jgi:Zn-dependent protease with chaperone function
MAHIARGHPALRRRLRIASVAAVWLVAFSFIGFASLQVAIGNPWPWWIWLLATATCLAAMLVPRAVQLAIYRRQEYEADRLTVEWLGSSGPMIALFDWLSTTFQPASRLLPARLWLARHPSTAARRQALARLATGEGHSSSGR